MGRALPFPLSHTSSPPPSPRSNAATVHSRPWLRRHTGKHPLQQDCHFSPLPGAELPSRRSSPRLPPPLQRAPRSSRCAILGNGAQLRLVVAAARCGIQGRARRLRCSKPRDGQQCQRLAASTAPLPVAGHDGSSTDVVASSQHDHHHL
ncbi:hypothetical protein BRADI_3g08138v3 [Brachypodium distachyon]|uniref:Uncharacterized protein n=1 Tax=Brachypodium distachyon TaxID=15368 RepID=A0A0Q3F3E3_BRADI|nr:hypothetical protein BRADI_3g08138v3 [Brachypodium distachyon]